MPRILGRPDRPATRPAVARGARHSRTGLVLVALAALSSCGDPVGLASHPPPTLRRLSIGEGLNSSLRPGGVVYIRGWPSDTTHRLQRGQRVPIDVHVASGDREAVGLYRRNCPARERGIGYECFEFQIFMEAGRSPHDVADHVEAIGGRFYLVSTNFAGIAVGYPEVARTAREAARWPGVAYTAMMGSGPCPEGVVDCNTRSQLMLPLRVDAGDPIEGDGILQVRSGDVVTVSYRQPDGSTLQATGRVP